MHVLWKQRVALKSQILKHGFKRQNFCLKYKTTFLASMSSSDYQFRHSFLRTLSMQAFTSSTWKRKWLCDTHHIACCLSPQIWITAKDILRWSCEQLARLHTRLQGVSWTPSYCITLLRVPQSKNSPVNSRNACVHMYPSVLLFLYQF